MKPFSASHLEKWSQCKRRERFIYGMNLREPNSIAADAGKAVHAVLEGAEQYLSVGKYPIAEMAARIAAVTPPGILRHEFEFNEIIDGIPFTGRIDAETADTIIDFKTTSKIKYVKTVRKLANDVQRLLYVQVRPEAEKTLWLTGVWSDLSVHPIWVPVDRKRDREKFKLYVLAPAEEIAALPEGIDPLSLEPNLAACDLFPPAGCPFKERCFPPNSMSIVMDTLMNKLKAEAPVSNTGLMTDRVASAEEVAGTWHDLCTQPIDKTEMPTHTIDTLYIDCYPTRIDAPVVEASTLISEAARQVQEDAHVHHPLLVDFGKGGPMLAAQLGANMKDKHFFHVYLETRSAEGKACVGKLSEMARVIIRGMF